VSATGQVVGVDGVLSELIARCAPTVHPQTMAAVISAESRGQQFAIADAGPVKLPWSQRKSMVRSFYMSSLDAAVAKATELISNGHTVSLGLAQVNDRNLRKYGLDVRSVFDPCTNVAVGGRILTDFYIGASRKFGANQKALHAAISAYNSGDWTRGANDGYVSRVYNQLGRPLGLQAKARRASFISPVTSVLEVDVPLDRPFAMSSGDFLATDAKLSE
jgi:type IV secretion system protein VirB1